ncbi:MAG: urea ABC transporter permease [Betaproteobacteria bacterium SG8_39]|nr:MAG: urea ABC transporter permease [Betaproteobacteria bacterium SG8_39]
MKNALRALVLALGLGCASIAAAALDAALVAKLAFGDNDEKIAAIRAFVTQGEPAAAPLLDALANGQLQTAGERVLIVREEAAIDAVSGETVTPLPEAREDVIANNRVRGELANAVAALRLLAPDRALRFQAVKELETGASAAMLPLVRRALEKETDAEIRATLALVAATIEVKSGDKTARLAAIRALASSDSPNTRSLLGSILLKQRDGRFVEPDADVRRAAEDSLIAVQRHLAWGERAGLLFAGVSLGSILLLAALGLAITYGLMGVINMAHGELIMIGAYATYVVQNLVRAYLPGAFDAYLLAAIPAAFIVSGLVGMALERSVIRHLYGRPLETLLATWGISLMLIQTVRTIFGAQNVQVENPAWMSGGIELMANVVLPWNRIMIIGFAALVVIGVALLLARTRLGLFVRGVTQNRAMASCVGVPTARVDTWAFGLGSGLAGLAGCALSQIGNVGPDLGQAYIVDSFMVVVFGGVGQLAGTLVAALGLGVINKLLEAWSGAVIAKIAVLVFIVLFIQKRPQGLFALKGRAVEA